MNRPAHLALNLRTGEVTALNVHPNYLSHEQGYIVQEPSSVPFRLTRNVCAFMTEFYEEGSFQLATSAYALVGGAKGAMRRRRLSGTRKCCRCTRRFSSGIICGCC